MAEQEKLTRTITIDGKEMNVTGFESISDEELPKYIEMLRKQKPTYTTFDETYDVTGSAEKTSGGSFYVWMFAICAVTILILMGLVDGSAVQQTVSGVQETICNFLLDAAVFAVEAFFVVCLIKVLSHVHFFIRL